MSASRIPRVACLICVWYLDGNVSLDGACMEQLGAAMLQGLPPPGGARHRSAQLVLNFGRLRSGAIPDLQLWRTPNHTTPHTLLSAALPHTTNFHIDGVCCFSSLLRTQPPQPTPSRTHQQARLVGLDALRERLLDVDGAADAVLCGAQGQLNLGAGEGGRRAVMRAAYVCG